MSRVCWVRTDLVRAEEIHPVKPRSKIQDNWHESQDVAHPHQPVDDAIEVDFHGVCQKSHAGKPTQEHGDGDGKDWHVSVAQEITVHVLVLLFDDSAVDPYGDGHEHGEAEGDVVGPVELILTPSHSVLQKNT